MIKLLIILLVGIGLGYTYGYMHGAAGEDSIISASLDKVGLTHGRASARATDDDAASTSARADSARQHAAIRPGR